MRKLLSPHELALLLVLLHAPLPAAAANVDLGALQRERLVEVVAAVGDDDPQLRLTSTGEAVLRRLGVDGGR